MSDVITDLLLVCFPIPIVLRSTMTIKRKLSLVLLFSLSLILVAITLYRIIGVIDRHSDQQFRSLLASLEILAAAAVSNAVVLGSFIRDRGEKKRHYRYGSNTGNSSLDASNNQQRSRTLTQRHWGSDADLVGDLGIRIPRDLEEQGPSVPRPAPVALPSSVQTEKTQAKGKWGFPTRPSIETDETDLKASAQDSDPEKQLEVIENPEPLSTPRRMSFFDVGGLLEHASAPRHPDLAMVSPIAFPHMTHVPTEGASESLHEADSAQERQRGSRSFMHDVGGLTSTTASAPPHQATMTLRAAPTTRNFSRPQSAIGDPLPPSKKVTEASVLSKPEDSADDHSPVFHDVGGLLD